MTGSIWLRIAALLFIFGLCLGTSLAQMAPPKFGEEGEEPVGGDEGAGSSEKAELGEAEEESPPPPAESGDSPPPPPPPPKNYEPAKAPAHPGDAYNPDCKYEDVPFTDCDPFHLVRWRQMKLTFGGSQCESYKNETEKCSTDDFPPGMIMIKTYLIPYLFFNFRHRMAGE